MLISSISIAIAFFALILSCIAFYKNNLSPFDLFVYVGKKNAWANKKDMFNLDLLITLCNLGKREGFIENLSVKIENGDTHIILKPDVFYKVSPNRLIQIDDFWSSFVLFGKETFSKNIGFICSAKIDSVAEGTKKATLNIEFKKNLKNPKILSYCKEFSFDFDRESARNKIEKERGQPKNVQ